MSPEELPLRGFLICPKCGYMLTGSASKGCKQYYYYYHCFPQCGIRFNAKSVNDKFVEQLGQYFINPAVIILYKTVLIQVYEQATENQNDNLSILKKQLNNYPVKIIKARELLLSGDLDGSDYKTIKVDCERQVSIIEGKLVQLSGKNEGIAPLLKRALKNVSRLPEIYQSAEYKAKGVSLVRCTLKI